MDDENDSHETTTTTSILERLRQKLVVVHPTTEDEARLKMRSIVQHQLEFPSKLRPAIKAAQRDENGAERPPAVFLSEVYRAVKLFLFGRYTTTTHEPLEDVHPDVMLSSSMEWNGLDRDVDTHDQAEVAIRFFPKVLNDRMGTVPGLCYSYPIYWLMCCETSVSFVPLFAQLGVEVGRFQERQRGGLKHRFGNVLTELLTNRMMRDVIGRAPGPEFLDECLAILTRLKEAGWIHVQEDQANLLERLFDAVDLGMELDVAFVERRLRFLIDWDPTVLLRFQESTSLLNAVESPSYIPRCDKVLQFQIFEVILELGMQYYPTEMGFVFHKLAAPQKGQGFHKELEIHNHSTFSFLCDKYGTERIKRILRDKLMAALASSNSRITLPSLVIGAATNEDIHLDGVYTLLHHNPDAVLAGT